MNARHHESGVARSAWLVIAVITAIVAGATFNKCLVCPPNAPADHPLLAQRVQPALPQGEMIDAPSPPAPPAVPPESEKDPEAPPPAPQDPEAESEPAPESEFLGISFEKLANYVYIYPDMDATKPLKDQIPETVKALEGKQVAIKGFMIPVKLEGEEVVEFLLVRNQYACCFGVMPKMNEWIHGKMAPGKTSAFMMDIPITCFGVLSVGEVVEDGVVMSLYRIECDEVTRPPEFK